MTEEELNIPTVKSYWIKEAKEALTVAEHLYEQMQVIRETYQWLKKMMT